MKYEIWIIITIHLWREREKTDRSYLSIMTTAKWILGSHISQYLWLIEFSSNKFYENLSKLGNTNDSLAWKFRYLELYRLGSLRWAIWRSIFFQNFKIGQEPCWKAEKLKISLKINNISVRIILWINAEFQ